MSKKLQVGTRVRMKRGVYTLFGWRGTGTIREITEHGAIKMVKDDDGRIALLASFEVVPLPDQTLPTEMHRAQSKPNTVWKG